MRKFKVASHTLRRRERQSAPPAAPATPAPAAPLQPRRARWMRWLSPPDCIAPARPTLMGPRPHPMGRSYDDDVMMRCFFSFSCVLGKGKLGLQYFAGDCDILLDRVYPDRTISFCTDYTFQNYFAATARCGARPAIGAQILPYAREEETAFASARAARHGRCRGSIVSDTFFALTI